MTSWTGQRVWVTGASAGLGRAVAEALIKAGATVAVTARRADALQELAGTEPGRVLVLPGSVEAPAEVERITSQIRDELGGLDALVHAAGVSPTFTRIEDTPEEDWRHVIDVNLTGAFHCCRAVPGLMAGGGRVVLMSSIHGRVGMARLAAYSASKGAIDALTRSLALEWADRGIRVNAVAPGYFETSMTQGLRASDVWRERLLSRIPLGRFGEADELVDAVLFLASDASAYMTGSILTLDGGWTAG